MANKPIIGTQIDVISPFAPTVQESFDLRKLDVFAASLGVELIHYRAMISPIGKSGLGDLRRNDGVDTISSNGMLYRCAGKFTATITDNERASKRTPSGVSDPSTSRLVMPRFYDKTSTSTADGDRIYLMPGDRLYIGNPNVDDLVANTQELIYESDRDNQALFPIVKLQENIIDSKGIEYTLGADFVITSEGNIRWCHHGKNPGIDQATGKGREFSIRYLYKAYYYVLSLPKELRITNVSMNGVRTPQRMAMHAIIVREYIFRNQNRGDKTNQNVVKTPQRKGAAPQENIDPDRYHLSVDMNSIADDDE